jgi:hypothetical protein
VVSLSHYFGRDLKGSHIGKGNLESIIPTPSLSFKQCICIGNQSCRFPTPVLLNPSTVYRDGSRRTKEHLDDIVLVVPRPLNGLPSNGVAASASTSADNTAVCALSVAYTSGVSSMVALSSASNTTSGSRHGATGRVRSVAGSTAPGASIVSAPVGFAGEGCVVEAVEGVGTSAVDEGGVAEEGDMVDCIFGLAVF